MRILQQHSKPPAILAFSLFTNDDPRNVAQLVAAVRATASRVNACAVWATIVRPPVGGMSYAGVNRRLKQLARSDDLALGLQIADWAGAVASQPSLLSGDGVHATAQGYATMARLYNDAIRRCAGEEL
jgi:lysophospholipase L1-like esterase